MEKAKNAIAKAATSLTLIVLVALGARLGFAWSQIRKMPQEAIGVAPFAHETGSIAYALATGKGFSSPFRQETGPTAWLTPVYPSLVAAVFLVFGVFTAKSFYAVVFLNSIFSAAACIPLYFAGKRISGSGVASGAAWLWALFPNAVMMPFEWVWDTTLAALLGAALLWATLELAEATPRARNWCAYGLLWGFTLMTNPSLATLLPVLLSWAAYRAGRKAKLSLLQPALAVAITVLCCVPWTVRNFVAFHKFIPLRSNFPLELYIGNNNNYASRQFVWPPKITREREIYRYFRMGETAFMEEEGRKAKEFIMAHPGIAVSLMRGKALAFWTGFAEALQIFETADSRLVQLLIACSALSALGALLGIAAMIWKRNPYLIPVAAYPLIFPWLYYITHPNLRYRHPIDPVNLLLVAIALSAALGLFPRKRNASESTAERVADQAAA